MENKILEFKQSANLELYNFLWEVFDSSVPEFDELDGLIEGGNFDPMLTLFVADFGEYIILDLTYKQPKQEFGQPHIFCFVDMFGTPVVRDFLNDYIVK